MGNFKNKLHVTILFLVFSMLKGYAQISGTNSTLSVANNTVSVVDNALTITATGNITDMTIQITDGYLAGVTGDLLGYTGSLPSGVTASYDNTKGVLRFTGTTSVVNWQILLRTVTIQTTSAPCYPEKRIVTFVLGDKYYNPLTGHYYQFATTAATWTGAKAIAEANSYYGRKGYLSTITSAAENNFVWKIMNTNTWIGCSDNYAQINASTGITTYNNQIAAEGNFFWITGPEAGTQFSQQNAWAAGGTSSVSGRYMNWASGEPNDWPDMTSSTPGEEDYGHMYSSTNGTWNDFPNTRTLPAIIEYGDMPNDATINNIGHSSRNIYVSGSSGGTLTGGNVNVCTGTNSTLLTLTGLIGSVVRWEYSYDNFLTTGVTISNTTTTYTATNLTQSTYYRAVVNSTSPTSCSNLPIASTAITVLTTLAGNITAASNSICAGGAAILTLAGNQGSVLKWQRSTTSNFASGNTDLANTTALLNDILASNGLYYYRVQVQKNSCGSPVYSSGITITVVSGTPSVGGIVSTLAYCGGSNAGTLNLTGHTGNVSKWQTSSDNGVVWTDIANLTTANNFTGITTTTLFRAVVQSGSCATSNSTAGMVDVTSVSGTWLGNSSNNWQTAGNWCGGIPSSSTNVIIPSGRANNPLLGSGTGYCNNITIDPATTLTVTGILQVAGSISQNGTFTASGGTIAFSGSSAQSIPASTFTSNTILNLTINNPAGVTLAGNQTVTGTLTFSSGLLTTSSSALLTMSSSTNAVAGAGNSKYINGPVKKSGTSPFIFPVGKGGKYAPCEISSPATSTDFTAEYFNTPYANLTITPGLINVSYKEYWNIDRTNGSAPINLSLYYYDPAFSGILNTTSTAETVVAHFNSGTGRWEDLSSGTKSITGTKVTMNSVNSFSPFTFGSPSGFSPLPVKILNFKAIPDHEQKSVIIKWQTTSEENCSHFEILHSEDLNTWTSLGKVNCAGANNLNNYDFKHLKPSPKNFYRLNQYEPDGNSLLSNIIPVYFNNPTEVLNIYPNPSSGSITLKNINEAGYEITDITGKIIRSGYLTGSETLFDLPRGILIIKLITGNTVQYQRLIIQ